MTTLRQLLGYPEGVTLLTVDMTPYISYGEFGDEFMDEFDVDIERAPFSFRKIARPDHPLWRKYQFTLAPNALLLWEDGTVKRVTTLTDPDILECDDVVLGGHLFVTPEGSWQAQVLEAAGYPLMEWVDPT